MRLLCTTGLLTTTSMHTVLCDSPDWDVADIKVFHIVRAFHVVVNHTFTCAAKSLNGINLSLLQSGNTQSVTADSNKSFKNH